MKHAIRSFVFLAFGLLLGACSPRDGDVADLPKADLLLINGKVYTANTVVPWAEAIAVKGGSVLFVGNNENAGKYRGESTRIIDLRGKMAMPGLIDAHVHPVLGGMEVATQCLFPSTADPQQVRETLLHCKEKRPDAAWIVGGRWDSAFFRKYAIDSPAKWLDNFMDDVPVSLADDTGHNRWVNSKALALVGINRDTLIPGGEIALDDEGEPNGLLLESAMYPVLEAIHRELKPTPEQYLEAARISLRKASEYGITGIKEAGDADQGVVAYRKLDQAGELNAHMVACIAVALTPEGELDLERLQRVRRENRSRNLNTDCAKLFLDGVPSEARTAAMIDNYLPNAEGHTHNGKLLVEPEALNEYLAQLDALGLTVKVHVAGDRAVRVTLDAIEHARRVNGDSGLRHELAHSGLIDPQDIPRIVELNAVADMSPSIWYPSPVTDSIIAALGERGRRYWPFKNLLEAGAEVIAGTDWPAVVPDMNPWPGIEAMVTRRHPDGAQEGALWAEQAISLEQALRIYTRNGAKALNLEEVTGSLEAGKRADIIVLNHNLFEIPAEAISDTRVEMTFFEGKLVFQREPAH